MDKTNLKELERMAISFNDLDDLATMIVYANPQKTVPEIAEAVGIARARFRIILGGTKAQIIWLIVETFGAAEDLTNFHITGGFPVPKIITAFYNPPDHLRLMLENIDPDSPYYPLELLANDHAYE